MKEKSSHKEDGEDKIPRIDPEAPGIPAGEELAIDPVGGDEIDPIDRWWDDLKVPDRSKVTNRRLEELDADAPPRRKKLRTAIAAELEAIPSVSEKIESPQQSDGDKVSDVEVPQGKKTGNIPLKAAPDSPQSEVIESAKPDLSDLFANEAAEAEGKKEAGAGTDPEAGTVKANREPEAEASEDAGTGKPEATLEALDDVKTIVKTLDEGASEKLQKPTEEADMEVADTAEAIDKSKKDDASAKVKKSEKIDGPVDPDEVEAADKSSNAPEPGAAVANEVLQLGAGQTKKKTGCWTVFATLFFFATILLLGGVVIVAALAWSQLGSFEEKITTLANEKLEEKGIYLDYGDWTYQFPRGLVFDEVTIFDDATKQRPLIKASSLGINVDMLGLIKDPGQLSSVEVSLENSKLDLFEAGELVTGISGIDGEILASAEQIRVDRLSADLGGLRVDTRGVVTLPKKEVTLADKTDAEKVKPAPLALDFTVFRQLSPWLAIESAEGNAPVLNLTFAMDAEKPDAATLEGSLSGREVIWRGIQFTSLSAAFNIVPETGELSFPSFQAGYGTGFIGGKVSIDTGSKILKIEQLQSTVDVIALLSAYDAGLAESLKLIRFVDAPTMQISGEVPMEDATQADLRIKYEHREGLVYLMGDRELPLRDLRGNFTLNGGSIETKDAALELFGGGVLINGATRLTDESRPFNGLIEIARMPMDKAAVFFGQEKVGMSGLLSLVFRGVGYKDVAKIRGGGSLRIDEASLPTFPVLGPVQTLVGQVIPAFAAKEKGSVTGAYIIESGVLLTSDLTVANGGARVVTNGSVNLASQDTKFTAKAVLDQALAAATGLTDKAITVEGSGPLASPVLKITDFPIEFASSSLSQVLGTTPKSLGSLKEILGGEADAAGVISGKIEEATGIKIDPEITDLFKSLLGGEKKPVTPMLRAQPQ